jgi:replicative DNA helicase
LGTGKTTFALWVLFKWLQRDMRVLMVSNENRAEDVIAKIDSYVAGFNPAKKRTREWTPDDINRLATVSYIANNMAGEMFIPNRPVGDIKELQGYIYTYKPDIVIVDGIYLMRGMAGESHWEKITNVSRGLKEIAEGEGVPLLGIHQASRKAIGTRIEVEHVAYSDALAQDADLMLAINAEDDGSVFVEAIKNRWGGENWGFFLRFFFNSMRVKVMDKTPPKVTP